MEFEKAENRKTLRRKLQTEKQKRQNWNVKSRSVKVGFADRNLKSGNVKIGIENKNRRAK
ncbi:hypothetical protein [Flavobacterium marginilacus]|uniref:hypothetical protein n=1 Tax=Flavobacterium marginilacus TaxID=3003256 RepID=UPI00248ED95D|nr:hypothetical protein [Flavobacterium marginilacus]